MCDFLNTNIMRDKGDLTFSYPGSLWYGFSFMRLCIETSTLSSDWAAVHAGPDHVLEWNGDSTQI